LAVIFPANSKEFAYVVGKARFDAGCNLPYVIAGRKSPIAWDERDAQ
jgi:hypothetical protein